MNRCAMCIAYEDFELWLLVSSKIDDTIGNDLRSFDLSFSSRSYICEDIA